MKNNTRKKGNGDVITGKVGANASGVIIGKNITQTFSDAFSSTPTDKQIIEQELATVTAMLQGIRDQLEATTVSMAEFQVNLLKSELIKVQEDETPSANAITQVGDWLLDNVPQLAEILTSLFASPAVGKVVGKAGEVAINWAKRRFGRSISVT